MHGDYISAHILLWLPTKSAYFKREVQIECWHIRSNHIPPTLTHESIYLRSSHLNMYTFSPQIIHPYVFTSHLLRVAYKIYAYCRAPNFHIQPITNTFVLSLRRVSENKIPVSLTYLVLDRATITTRATTCEVAAQTWL